MAKKKISTIENKANELYNSVKDEHLKSLMDASLQLAEHEMAQMQVKLHSMQANKAQCKLNEAQTKLDQLQANINPNQSQSTLSQSTTSQLTNVVAQQPASNLVVNGVNVSQAIQEHVNNAINSINDANKKSVLNTMAQQIADSVSKNV